MVETVISQNLISIAAYPSLGATILEELALDAQESRDGLADPSVRQLSLDENLFREGELKTGVYRLDAGMICVSEPQWNGPPKIIEIVFPGNLIGLGFLKRNIYNAKAVVDSRVSCWPLDAIPTLVEDSNTAKRRQAEATEREFAYRRNALCGLTEDKPVERVAAFLVAVSRLSEVEGRDPDMISDTLHCGAVADYLGLTIDTLREALVELEARAMVEQCLGEGLRICDRDGLDRLTPLAWQLSGVG